MFFLGLLILYDWHVHAGLGELASIASLIALSRVFLVLAFILLAFALGVILLIDWLVLLGDDLVVELLSVIIHLIK